MRFLEEQCTTTYDNLINDEVLRRAVLRSIEVIGEAAKNLPAPFREVHAEVLWKAMVGMRGRLIHAYFSVDREIIRDV